MRPSELLHSLHEANKRLQARLDEMNLRSAELTAAQYAELKWLAKDDEDLILTDTWHDKL